MAAHFSIDQGLMTRSALLILLIIFFPHVSFSYTEMTGLFIDDGVSSLARGGMKRLPESQESLDFNSPLFLDSKGKIRSDITFEHQRTIHVNNGSWAGSHAYSDQLESSVAAPFSLWDGALAGDLAAGYGYRSFDVKAESSKEKASFAESDRFSARKGGLFLKVQDKVTLGISLVDTDYRSRPEIPIEVAIKPVEYLSIGYKRSYTDIAGNFSAFISGSNGTVPLVYAEEKNELSLKGEYKGIVMARYAQELRHPGNNRITGRLELPGSLYLAGDYHKRSFMFNQEFYVVDLNGGYLKGEGALREYRIGVGADLGKRWNVEANFRHQNLDSSGGGIANSSAIVNFWPSLLVGNYNHLYSVALESNQYHLGAEYKGEKASFGIGCQYLDLRPVAEFTYWRSLLFGLGQTGLKTLKLDTDRIQLLFLSLGAGYHWDMFSLNFAFGQYMPIAIHDRSTLSTPASSDGNGGGGKDIFSKIGDYINHNPGGNIVRFMASFYF
jgi:hypothetical protein